jgi:hypothetical protein
MRRSTRVLGSWSTRSHSGRIGDSHRFFPCLTLAIRPTRMCRSDHRRKQLIGQLTGITVAVQPPRTRPVHESPALSDVGIAPKPLQGVAGDCGGLLIHLSGSGQLSGPSVWWRTRRSFRFVWTKHLPTQSEVWGPSRRGFGTVQQTQFDDVTQMVKISDRRFVVAAPQDAIHGS